MRLRAAARASERGRGDQIAAKNISPAETTAAAATTMVQIRHRALRTPNISSSLGNSCGSFATRTNAAINCGMAKGGGSPDPVSEAFRRLSRNARARREADTPPAGERSINRGLMGWATVVLFVLLLALIVLGIVALSEGWLPGVTRFVDIAAPSANDDPKPAIVTTTSKKWLSADKRMADADGDLEMRAWPMSREAARWQATLT